MNLFRSLKNKISFYIYKLQKYFKIDFFYLIKGEFWLMLGKIVSIVSTFIVALAWANWMDKGIYGNYQYIISLVGLISIFSLPEMEAAIIQAVARGFEGTFIAGFKTKLKWGLLGSLSSLGIAGYYFLEGNKNLPLAFVIISVFLFLFNASLAYTGFLVGRRLFNIQVKYDVVIQAIAGLVMLSTLFCIKRFLFDLPDFLIILLVITAYFISRTSLRFFFFYRTKNKFTPNTKQDPKSIPYGKKLSFSGVIDCISGSLDKILLFHYLGAVELAVYAFSILVPQQINAFLKHIGTLALPRFSLRSRDELRKTVLKKMSYLAILVSFFVVVYIIFAPWVYQLFFPQYLESVPYSRLFALSIIPLAFSMGGLFRAKMMTKQIYQMRVIVPVVRAVLFIVLIPFYGILGAVLAILITRTFSAFIAVFFFKRSF